MTVLSVGAAGTGQESGTGAPIVVGVDGSACARHAVAWAAAEAKSQGRGLDLVHVQRPESLLSLARRDGSAEREAVRAQAAALLADGMPTRVSVADGEPGQVLVGRSVDAAMLVLGAWGRSSRAGLLLGSVAQHCARHSRCPIVLVPLPPEHPLNLT